MKAIFEVKEGSGYKDEITRWYHFPANRPYLEAAQGAVGDWIVYRRTKRNGGDMAYFAVAQVTKVAPDPQDASHAYAYVANFLEFDRPVPFSGVDGFAESWLKDLPNASQSGRSVQGKSLRPLSDTDFAGLVLRGLNETLAPENARRLELDDKHADAEARDLLTAPLFEQERRVVQILTNKKIRAANFRHHVLEAYEDTCAVTRLKIINGGGKPEAQAAHIWGVGEGGPDTVPNGIALSATVHWLFDRHLISLTDDYGLLVSHNRVPSELRPLFERQMERIHLPRNPQLWPSTAYVQLHRERFAA